MVSTVIRGHGEEKNKKINEEFFFANLELNRSISEEFI